MLFRSIPLHADGIAATGRGDAMKYVVAEVRDRASHPIRVIVSQKQWPDTYQHAGWVKLFEAETVAEAEALEALLPPAIVWAKTN